MKLRFPSPSLPLCVLFGSWILLSSAAPARAADGKLDFAHDIAPILRAHCVKCHTGDKKQGGFSLNTRAELLAGGENGSAIVSGKSAASDLIRRITTADADLHMPPAPEKPVSAADFTRIFTQAL